MESWEALLNRLRRVTPVEVLRLLLAVAILLGMFRLVQAAWFALLPFIAGAIIAYIVLPLVDWLDRFLPRSLAALLVMLASLAGNTRAVLQVGNAGDIARAFVSRDLWEASAPAPLVAANPGGADGDSRPDFAADGGPR